MASRSRIAMLHGDREPLPDDLRVLSYRQAYDMRNLATSSRVNVNVSAANGPPDDLPRHVPQFYPAATRWAIRYTLTTATEVDTISITRYIQLI